jgi:hypothetical protein
VNQNVCICLTGARNHAFDIPADSDRYLPWGHQLTDFLVCSQHFNSSNTIVAASGMPMAVAESLTGELLSQLPSGPASERPESHYVGGGTSEHSTAASAVVVAFESAGWADMKGAVLATVVRNPTL